MRKKLCQEEWLILLVVSTLACPGWGDDRVTLPLRVIVQAQGATEPKFWPSPSGGEVLVAYSEAPAAKRLALFSTGSKGTVKVLLDLSSFAEAGPYEVTDARWDLRGKRVAVEVSSEDVVETLLWEPSSGSVRRIGCGSVASASPRWAGEEWLFFLPGVEDPEHADGLFAVQMESGKLFKFLSGEVFGSLEVVGSLVFLGKINFSADHPYEMVTAKLRDLERSGRVMGQWDLKSNRFIGCPPVEPAAP